MFQARKERGGDNIRKLKMQRLNVGFSRAKDCMVFVHSMDLGDYSDTRRGNALRHYHDLRQLEYHTKNPERVTAQNFDREYLEYDIQRQIELESYGYRFLRIHKFSLLPTSDAPTPVAVLDRKLREAFR